VIVNPIEESAFEWQSTNTFCVSSDTQVVQIRVVCVSYVSPAGRTQRWEEVSHRGPVFLSTEFRRDVYELKAYLENFRKNKSMKDNNEIHHVCRCAERLLTTKQVAVQANVTERHIQKLVKAGEFPKPVMLGRAVRFRPQEVHDFLFGAENSNT
jgi:excisionase family DNA binding protein